MSKIMKCLMIFSMAALLIGCKRKKLEDPYQYLAHIPVSIDWSESLVDEDDISHVSIYFYPHDGGEPTIFFSNDINYCLVRVPVGEYSVSIFNDLVDDAAGVKSYDYNSYASHTFRFMVDDDTATDYYTKSDDELLSQPHTRMASWSTEEFIVDKTMVEYTRSQSFKEYIEEVRSKSRSKSQQVATKEGEVSDDEIIPLPASKSDISRSMTKSIEELANVVTLPETTIVNVKARVINLNNAMYFRAIAKGTARGTYVNSDKAYVEGDKTNIYYISVRNRVFDDPKDGTDGYVSFTFNTFGRVESDEHYNISFRVAQLSGVLKEFERDVTKWFVDDNDHIIDIVLDDAEAIELDPGADGGFNVGGWENGETVYL